MATETTPWAEAKARECAGKIERSLNAEEIKIIAVAIQEALDEGEMLASAKREI